jgi:predicted ATPase
MVGLREGSYSSDVQQFQRAVQQAMQHDFDHGRADFLAQAVEVWGGELLAGQDGDWIILEAHRQEEQYFRCVQQLVTYLRESGQFIPAREYALQALAVDPLHEELHQELMRVYLGQANPLLALRQYENLKQLVLKEFKTLPHPVSQQLAEAARQQTVTGPKVLLTGAGREKQFAPRETVGAQTGGKHAISNEPRFTPITSSAPLPIPRTKFFGRHRELDDLHALVTKHRAPSASLEPWAHRVITITGLGGAGKTRLALELLRRLQQDADITAYDAGPTAVEISETEAVAITDAASTADQRQREFFCSFVPLSGLSDTITLPDAVASSIRTALGLQHKALEGSPQEQIGYLLANRQSLLVLDNFEQLLPEGAWWVNRLTTRVPGLTVLVTSRERLSIEGEYEYPLSLLELPDQTASPDELLLSESVQLFQNRAEIARAVWRLTPQNVEAVAHLCRRLEGWPLALELAAARASLFTPRQMLTELENRLDFLSAADYSGHSGTQHHYSLRASLDWSYDLLSPELQQFLANLSVFRGTWTASASAIADEARAFQYLTQLQTCSLLTSVPGERQMRFRLLDTVRDYCAAKVTPEQQKEMSRRHALYYSEVAQCAVQKLQNSKGVSAQRDEALDCLQNDADNIRAALDWAYDHQPLLGLQLAASLAYYWETYCLFNEGLALLQRALQAVGIQKMDALPEQDATMLQVLSALGTFEFFNGEFARAYETLQQALAVGRARGDDAAVASALLYQGIVALYNSNPDARTILQESLDLMRGVRRSCGVPFLKGEATALLYLGLTWMFPGDFQQAVSLLNQSVEVAGQTGENTAHGMALFFLGDMARTQSDFETAAPYFEQALEFSLREHQWVSHAYAMWGMGRMALGQRKLEEARTYLDWCQNWARTNNHKWGLTLVIEAAAHLTLVDAHSKRATRAAVALARTAASLLGSAHILRETISFPLTPSYVPEYQQYEVVGQRLLGTREWDNAKTRGHRVPLDEALALVERAVRVA